MTLHVRSIHDDVDSIIDDVGSTNQNPDIVHGSV